MLRLAPHSADPADPAARMLASIRVALLATLTARCVAGRAVQVRWQRPGLTTHPAQPREATP